MNPKSDQSAPDPPVETPQSFWVGQDLDWDAETAETLLVVELPFWLMVAPSVIQADVAGHVYPVEIRDDLSELYVGAICDSRSTSPYIGEPVSSSISEGLRDQLLNSSEAYLWRHTKSVLRIKSMCNIAVLHAMTGEHRVRRQASLYLQALCTAHIPIVNHVIQQYRLATYDYHAFAVNPWDVPIWWVLAAAGQERIELFPYAAWDEKPRIIRGEDAEVYALIDRDDLQRAMETRPSPGEWELLDAMNLMERGDYSGAVRRVVTSIEVVMEAVLRKELTRRHPPSEVEAKLEASKNDFPGRRRQYERLTGRMLPTPLADALEEIRMARHGIVHRGERINFPDRHTAQEYVDKGRWIFNWYEDDADRQAVREKRVAFRSLGRQLGIFSADLTDAGPVVHKPL